MQASQSYKRGLKDAMNQKGKSPKLFEGFFIVGAKVDSLTEVRIEEQKGVQVLEPATLYSYPP